MIATELLRGKLDQHRDREYAWLQLDNGLEALLISNGNKANPSQGNESLYNAAAAMAVQVGSFADPPELEGCAHFLEHMVFMGSEKYPDENYYDSFVSSHGGGCNAFTEGEHTVYNFDITPDHFAKGLDIFANCFISPLLADSAVDREVNAIDNEFNSAILDDGSRLQQLFSHFAPDEHILHKFSWGNRKSIIDVPKKNKVNARKVLRDFHEQNYTPNSMKLVVMSSAPIEELRCNVLASFQNWNVKSGGERPTKKKKSSGKGKTVDLKSLEESLQRSTQLSLFNSNDNLTVRRFFPVKDCHKVAMYWELPSMVGRYRSKPHGYLGHLLGHEGPGSLLSKLKELNFATDLSAGTCDSNFDTNSVYTLFTLSISLTEKGIVNWPQVVCVVYQYLSMLKATPPQKWIFDELQQMTKIGFDFLDDVDVADFVEELVVELLPLRERQRSDILAASHLYWEWDPKVISDLLDNYITANKAMLYIYSTFYRPPGTEDDNSDEDEEDDDEEGSDEDGSDEDDDSGSNGTDDSKEEAVEISIEQLEKLFGELYSCGAEWKNYCYPPFLLEVKSSIEPHFRTTYWEQTLTKEILESWYNPSLDQSLHLPPINPYIPQNLDLLNETLMEKDNSRAPSKVYAENGISLWYLYDNSFFTPKAEVIIKLASPAKYKDARNSAIGELFCSLVKDSINEQLYLASMAELDVHIHSEDASINIRVSGFNDKICQLAIDCVLTLLRFDQNIINGTCTQETLSRVLEEYTRNCQNRQMKAAKVSTTGRLLALKPTKFSPSELLQVLSNESMSFQSIQSFLQEFRANLCVEILVQGNVNEQESISLAKSISSECQGNSSIEQQIVNLTTESISILSVLVDNPLEKNVGVEIYFQLGSFSVESVSMLDLLDKLISEPVFDTLRTKKQLGYFVSCGVRQTFGVLGFCFKVVSSTHTIEDIQKEILLFVINIKALLLSLNQTQKQDEDYFNNNLIALEHNLSEPYKNLYCAASNKWSVIDDGTYQFDIKQQQLHFYKNQQKSIQKRIDLEAMLLFVDELFIQKAKLLIVYASKQLIKSFANIDIEPYAGRPIKFYQDHRKFHLENAFY